MISQNTIKYQIKMTNKECKIKGCNNSAKAVTEYPSSEQRWYLKATDGTFYICDKCKDSGWKYNIITDEYYFRHPKTTKVKLEI